jgi:hypothetical protein
MQFKLFATLMTLSCELAFTLFLRLYLLTNTFRTAVLLLASAAPVPEAEAAPEAEPFCFRGCN